MAQQPPAAGTADMETVEAFRARARAWLATNLPPRPPQWRPDAAVSEKSVARARQLLALLCEGGLTGITWPVAYGGQGLTAAHEWAFHEEAGPYEMPQHFGSTLRKVAEVILAHGSEEQKLAHLPAIARGEELWGQYLSEPSGGSDLAGALTSAVPDGDRWILNGSKIWTTNGAYADYGLCLARTDWDVPKHAGLSMFIVPVGIPGLTVVPIRQVTGDSTFCVEFLDNVAIPLSNLVGELNEGWRVARTLLVHERNAFAVTPAGGAIGMRRGFDEELLALAAARGVDGQDRVRQLLVEAKVRDTVNGQLAKRITAGQRAGLIPGPAGSMIKLALATAHIRRADIAMEIAGPTTVGWDPGDRALAAGVAGRYLGRQGMAIGGGTSEIQRNTIGERLLGLPREPGNDEGPFRLVRTNAISTRPGPR